jgi:hypothetical protein
MPLVHKKMESVMEFEVESGKTVAEFEVESGKTVVESGKTVAEFGKTVAEFGKTVVEFGKTVVEKACHMMEPKVSFHSKTIPLLQMRHKEIVQEQIPAPRRVRGSLEFAR